MMMYKCKSEFLYCMTSRHGCKGPFEIKIFCQLGWRLRYQARYCFIFCTTATLSACVTAGESADNGETLQMCCRRLLATGTLRQPLAYPGTV